MAGPSSPTHGTRGSTPRSRTELQQAYRERQKARQWTYDCSRPPARGASLRLTTSRACMQAKMKQLEAENEELRTALRQSELERVRQQAELQVMACILSHAARQCACPDCKLWYTQHQNRANRRAS